MSEYGDTMTQVRGHPMAGKARLHWFWRQGVPMRRGKSLRTRLTPWVLLTIVAGCGYDHTDSMSRKPVPVRIAATKKPEAPSTRRVQAISTKPTRLSPQHVFAVATRAATLRGIDVSQYEHSQTIAPDVRSSLWSVSFNHVPYRWFGDHFTISVDDSTGATTYIGGE